LNAAWGATGLPVCLASNTQQFPVVTTSAAGTAIVTWQDLRSGGATSAAIYAAQAIVGSTTGVGNDDDDVVEGVLGLPHPNPSRGPTSVQLSLPHAAFVRAEVFDLSGRRVATVASETFSAGTHFLTWDGSLAAGGRAAPGVYLVHVKWEGFDRTQRIVRLR
jgi:hypothetical protein